mmetsp:Transcript_115232/g.200584  ORF Transcript_115232/g.200584 Transcript_115232/m.200584 type:complete len:199 (-) Transcript_115232:142-738(-)
MAGQVRHAIWPALSTTLRERSAPVMELALQADAMVTGHSAHLPVSCREAAHVQNYVPMECGALIVLITVLVWRRLIKFAQDTDVAASGRLVLGTVTAILPMQARTVRQSAMEELKTHAWDMGSAMMGPKGMAAASVTMNGGVKIVQYSVLVSQPKVKSVVRMEIALLMDSVSAMTIILAILKGWPARCVKTTGSETDA